MSFFPAMPKSVTEFFRGSQTNDVELWAGSFAPDGVFHDPVGSDPIVGRDSIRERLKGAMAAFDPFNGLQPTVAYATGGSVAVSWIGAVVHRETGNTVNWAGITVFDLNADGSIHTASAYFNHDVFSAQLNGH